MTPNGSTPASPVTRKVFDLSAFDDVYLVKPFTNPPAPSSVDEALAAVGNDKSKLLEIIHKGLILQARDAAYNDIEHGFLVVGEDGEAGEAYIGRPVDDEKGKLINAAILSLAKMQGYEKSLSKEKKRELKDKATSFLRQNPAMLESIQG